MLKLIFLNSIFLGDPTLEIGYFMHGGIYFIGENRKKTSIKNETNSPKKELHAL